MRIVIHLLVLLLDGAFLTAAQAAGLDLSANGITFPDGSLQTTAAGGQGKCTEITQSDIPLTISAKGVYCLTEDVSSGPTAITIRADNVVLNLNGYLIDGSSAGSNTIQEGIFCQDRKNVVITNGAIKGYFWGVLLNNCDGAQVTHLRVMQNYGSGIDMFNGSDNVLIAHNHIYHIGGTTRSGFMYMYGISVRSDCPGARILENDIYDVFSPTGGRSYGIRAWSTAGEVSNNRISGLITQGGGLEIPISFIGKNGLLRNNTISGSGTNAITYAISVGGIGSSALCADNKVIGFTTATSGCNDGGGNVAVP